MFDPHHICLYRMCRTVEITAPDYRKEIRKASGFSA
jgi:hypothetical protein